MADWIDNADSYLCPVCGFECNNPNRFYGKCPKCGFIATKDIRSSDVVEVVRCKDCKHGVFDEGKGVWKCVESAEWDESIGDWFGFVSYKTHDFYCSNGERRDNG